MSYSPRVRTYIFSDANEFEIVEVDGEKRIYVNGDSYTDDGCGARIAIENVCDACGKGVPATRSARRPGFEHVGAVRFDIRGGGPRHKLDTGGFYHVACLPDFLRPSVQEVTTEA